jgi:hypothetical protein
MPESGAESYEASARGVERFVLRQTRQLKQDATANTPNFYTQLTLWQ